MKKSFFEAHGKGKGRVEGHLEGGAGFKFIFRSERISSFYIVG